MALKVHEHYTRRDQPHADELARGGHLLVGQQAHQHDRHDADATPEGIGDAEGNGFHHPGEQQKGDGIGPQHHQGGQGSAEPLGELETRGAHDFGAHRQEEEQPRIGRRHGGLVAAA